ncbi:MAG TPA: LysR family transcriptional regulator [Pseudonocardia sp.]|jgi:DNA-binding transcriptional LysR family regulator
MIDLRRVHVLRVVDQLGTITAAATSLHLTPSAVSQQLRQLAREMRLPLLEPDGRRVRLTPAAHALLEHADDLAARWERARGELDCYAEQAGGVVRLCGFASVFRSLVIPAVLALRAADPLLDVRVLEVETADAFERLLADDADVAITLPTLGGPTADDPRFEQRPLLDEPQDLLVPAGHPLAGRADAALEETAHEHWILPEPHSCDQYSLVSVACATAGFTPRVAHHAKDWGATFALVGAGFGVCLKPRPVPLIDELTVAQVPLREPTPRRQLLTCTRRGSRGQRPIAMALDALADAAARATPAGAAA